ncbi:hypothetical protein TcWFU_002286 [Taenia crassiceps]|uniref:Uncharacterized protein n=1 Tax=Taenia crassiceps TaxID=6207 RepID=A0ABR4QJW1_9CEST
MGELSRFVERESFGERERGVEMDGFGSYVLHCDATAGIQEEEGTVGGHGDRVVTTRVQDAMHLRLFVISSCQTDRRVFKGYLSSPLGDVNRRIPEEWCLPAASPPSFSSFQYLAIILGRVNPNISSCVPTNASTAVKMYKVSWCQHYQRSTPPSVFSFIALSMLLLSCHVRSVTLPKPFNLQTI